MSEAPRFLSAFFQLQRREALGPARRIGHCFLVRRQCRRPFRSSLARGRNAFRLAHGPFFYYLEMVFRGGCAWGSVFVVFGVYPGGGYNPGPDIPGPHAYPGSLVKAGPGYPWDGPADGQVAKLCSHRAQHPEVVFYGTLLRQHVARSAQGPSVLMISSLAY